MKRLGHDTNDKLSRRKLVRANRVGLVESLERRDHPGAMLPISLADFLTAILDYEVKSNSATEETSSASFCDGLLNGLSTRFREQLDRRRLNATRANGAMSLVNSSFAAINSQQLDHSSLNSNQSSKQNQNVTQTTNTSVDSANLLSAGARLATELTSGLLNPIVNGQNSTTDVLSGATGVGNGASTNSSNAQGSAGDVASTGRTIDNSNSTSSPMGSFTPDLGGGGGGGSAEYQSSNEGPGKSLSSSTGKALEAVTSNSGSASAPSLVSPPLNTEPLQPTSVPRISFGPQRNTAIVPNGTLSVNTLPMNTWQSSEQGGSEGFRGEVSKNVNSISLREGDSFQVVAYRDIELPSDTRYLSIDYAVSFDLSDRLHINDAFEIALLDDNGRSILPSISSDRDSLFNFTEEEQIALGAKTTHSIRTSVDGTYLAGSVTVDALVLHQLASPAHLVVRLVNNDTDSNSSLRLVVNTSPDAMPDEYSSVVGQSIIVNADEGVLKNDFDADGDKIVAAQTVAITTGPVSGNLLLNSDGSFHYTPNTGFTGDDGFTYRAFDGSSYSSPVSVTLRYIPTVTGVFVNSTFWNNRFAYASTGYEIIENGPNLPWFNLNQVRITFSEPISNVTARDLVISGGTLAGASSRPDYNQALKIVQPDPTTLELTLRDGLVFKTDKLMLKLLETIKDLSGNGLDGNKDGRSGDPSDTRFNVVRGDVDNNNSTLANDVTIVTEHQFGRGTYHPFYDLNGNTSILANDVTLATQNQFSFPNADTAWSFLSAPVTTSSIASRSKFYTVDSATSSSFRYGSTGQSLNPLSINSAVDPRGIALTAAGDRMWVLNRDGRVSVVDPVTGYLLGEWQAQIDSSNSEVLQPEDITTDGTNLWIVDAASRQIVFYANAAKRLSGSQTASSTFRLATGNDSPTGLVTNNEYLWVTDSTASKVFVYSLNGNLLGSWALDARNSSASGITLNPIGISASDGLDLWVVNRSDAVVYRYSGAIDWRASSLPATSTFALNSSNSFPEGIADPPIASALLAATVTYIGPNNGTWGNPAFWSTQAVPSINDIVEIPVNRTVHFAGIDSTVRSIQGLGSLELQAISIGNQINNKTILRVTDESNISNIIQNGGVLVLDGTTSVASLRLNGGILRGNGLISSGDIRWTGGGMQGAGTTYITKTDPVSVNLTILGTELWIGDGRTIENEGNVSWNSNVAIGRKADEYSVDSDSARLTISNSPVRFRNTSSGVVSVGQLDSRLIARGMTASQALYFQTNNLANIDNQGLFQGIQDFHTDALWNNQGNVYFLNGSLVMGEGLINSTTGIVQAKKVQIGSGRAIALDSYFAPMGQLVNAGQIRSMDVNGTRGDLTVSIHSQSNSNFGEFAVGKIKNLATGKIFARAFEAGENGALFGVSATLINEGDFDVIYGSISGSLVNELTGTIQSSGLRIGSLTDNDPNSLDFRGDFENYGSMKMILSSTPPSGWTATQINTIEIAGDFINRGSLSLPINGAASSSQYGRVRVVTGIADLDGGLLLTPTGSPAVLPYDAYTFIEVVRSVKNIVGAFDLWPEGQVYTLFSNNFHATYRGGRDENDFQLINNGIYVKINDPFVTEGNVPNGIIDYSEMVFNVELDSPAITPITIPYQTEDLEASSLSDYEATSGILTIPVGEKSGRIVVRVRKDLVPELGDTNDRNERFTLKLSPPTSNNAILQKAGGIGTILADDGATTPTDSRGQEFWLAFTNTLDSNMSTDAGLTNDFVVYVAGSPGTRVTITTFPQDGVSAPQIYRDLIIPPSGLLEKDLASMVLLPNVTGIISGSNTSGLQSASVNVTASADVSVYSLMFITCGTSSSALAFPSDVLGGEYRILTPRNMDIANAVSQTYQGDGEIAGGLFAVIATENDTRVIVTPTVSSGVNRAGIPFAVILQKGQIYQYIASNRQLADLSGTLVTSDKPIAVLSGHQYAQVPKDLSHQDSTMESIPPVNTWGREFIIADTKRDPKAGKPPIEDNYRVMAAENETVIRVNNTIVATLDAGQVFEFQMDGQGTIKANKPVMVMQMTDGSANATASANDPDAPTVAWGMPSAILIPPYEQFLAEYTVAIPSYFPDGYINIVTPSAGISGLRLNTNAFTADQLSQFTQVNNSEYSVVRLKVTPGQSVHLKGVLPFGVTVYGFESHNTHGYLGGLSLSPVATATGIAMTPTEAVRQVTLAHSVTARVSNEIGIGVPGVRVDFVVTGTNQTLGFAVTDVRGDVKFEFVGVNLGVDKITASVGQLRTEAEVLWTVAPPTVQVDSPVSGASFQAGNSILISGQARAGQNGVRITRVTVDDVPAEAVDALGNFFTHISLASGKRDMQITAYDSYGQSVSTTYSLTGTVGPSRGLDTRSLVDAKNIKADYLRTSFLDDRRLLFAEVQFVNNGSFTLEKPLYVGVKNLSDPSIIVQDFDGFTEDGTYYWNISSLVPGETLDVGERTATRSISFRNPNRVRFTYDWIVLSNINDAPLFSSTPQLAVHAGKEYRYLPKAVDPDGHPISISLLNGPSGMAVDEVSGVVRWSPSLLEKGNHSVSIRATDSRGRHTIQTFVLEVLSEATNRAPSISSTPVVAANVRLPYEYLLESFDPDGDEVAYSLSPSTETISGLEIVGNKLRWIPTADQVGENTITIIASDGHLSGRQTFVVDVDMQVGNTAPTIFSTPQTKIAQGVPYRYQVDALDADSDVLHYSLIDAPLGMTIDSRSGLIVWGNPQSPLTTSSVSVLAKDGRGGTVTQAFNLVFAFANMSFSGSVKDTTYSNFVGLENWVVFVDTNRSGLRESDEPFAETDNRGNYSISNLLENRYAIRVERPSRKWIVETPSSGQFVRNLVIGNPEVVANNILLPDFQFIDHPTEINRTPNFMPINDQVVVADSMLQMSIAATDPDGDAVRYSLRYAQAGMQLDPITGVFTWTPSRDWVGESTSVIVSAIDSSSGIRTASFNINVTYANNPPVFLTAPSAPAFVTKPYTFHATAADPEGQSVTYRLVTSIPGMTLSAIDGTLSWIPSATQAGDHTITIRATDDSQGFADQSFILKVIAPNQSPVITSSPVVTAKVDSLYRYDIHATDQDATDNVSIQVVAKPDWLLLNGSALSGTPSLNDLTQVNQPGDSVVIEVKDSRGATRTQSFTIQVLANSSVEVQNHSPVFSSGPATFATIGTRYSSNILVGDPDVGDLVSLLPLSTLPEWLTLTSIPGVANSYRLSGTPRETDIDSTSLQKVSLQFKATDNHGASSIDSFDVFLVMPNRSPTATLAMTSTASPNRQVIGRIDAIDLDSDALSYSVLSGPNGLTIDSAGIIRWQPNDFDVSTILKDLKFVVSDGQGHSVFIEHKILVTNDLIHNQAPQIISNTPLFAALGGTLRYQAVANDPDNDPLWWRLVAAPEGAVIHPSLGTVQWKPNAFQAGLTHRFEIEVSDLRSASSQIFATFVPNANYPPEVEFAAYPKATVGNVYTYGVRAIDPDEGRLFYSLQTPNFGPNEKDPLLENAIIDTKGVVHWKPHSVGVYRFQIVVSDEQGGSAIQEFTVNASVSEAVLNRPPRWSRAPSFTGLVGQTYLSLFNAADPDQDFVTYRFVPLTSGDLLLGELDILDPANTIVGPSGTAIANGILQFTPAFAKPYRVRLEASDAFGGFTQSDFVIHVFSNNSAPNNRAPTLASTPYHSAVVGSDYRYNVIANDLDGDMLTYSLSTPTMLLPGEIDGRTGFVDLNPNSGEFLVRATNPGTYRFNLNVDDGQGGLARQEFTVVFELPSNATNEPPAIKSLPVTRTIGGVSFKYQIIATDPDGDALFYTLHGVRQVGSGIVVSNASIDRNGLVTWNVPVGSEGTSYQFDVSVSDRVVGNSPIHHEFVVQVIENPLATSRQNNPPRFESTSKKNATASQLFVDKAAAVDPDGDAVTYSLIEGGSEGILIHPDTGELTWTPAPLNLGQTFRDTRITIQATDTFGQSAFDRYTVRVLANNNAPSIQSIPNQSIIASRQFAFDVIALDPDGEAISYSVSGLPGATIDTLGRLRYLSTLGESGSIYNVTVTAIDTAGLSSEVAFNLSVLPDQIAPVVSMSVIPNDRVQVDKPVQIQTASNDNVGVVRRELAYQIVPISGALNSNNWSEIEIDFSGYTSFSPSVEGILYLRGRAFDASGNVAEKQVNLKVYDPNLNLPIPVLNPLPQASITTLTNITGSILGDVSLWQLQISSQTNSYSNSTRWTTIASGTGVMPEGSSLGLLDPTTINNGSYNLRLIAYNGNGEQSETSQTLIIEGLQKVGNFTIALTDLSLSVAGLPVTIARSYDTLRANEPGDFGNGWQMVQQSLSSELQANTPTTLGTRGYPGFKDGTRVLITLPDGSVEGFTFDPQPSRTFFGRVISYRPNFKPDNGNKAVLEVNEIELTKTDEGYTNGAFESYSPMDPLFGNEFIVTTYPDRKVHVIDATSGEIKATQDQNGNIVSITENGIESSRGRGLAINRDWAGRITSIVDPQGARVLYEYDDLGNLTKFYDRVQAERLLQQQVQGASYNGIVAAPAEYFYSSPINSESDRSAGFLNAILDPSGVQSMSSEYSDVTGRLSKVIDASGKQVQMDYDFSQTALNSGPTAGQITVTGTNQLGKNSVVVLDSRGNPIRQINEVGDVVLTEFAPGTSNPTKQTQVVGQVDSALNGESNDISSSFTFNSFGQATSQTDTYGSVSTTHFNSQGQLQATTDTDGNKTFYSYDRRGNISGTFDSFGAGTRYTYQTNGDLKFIASNNIQIFDPDTNEFYKRTLQRNLAKLDANFAPNALPRETLEEQENYRAASEYYLVMLEEAKYTAYQEALSMWSDSVLSNNVTALTYNDSGDLAKVMDPDKNVRNLITDESGNQTGSSFVWNDPANVNVVTQLDSRVVLDANGRPVVSATSVNGVEQASTQTFYDDMGRVWKTIDSNGLESQSVFDVHGLVVEKKSQSQDSFGTKFWNVSRTVYDDAGRITFASNSSLEGTTVAEVTGSQTFYDDAGRVTNVKQLKGVDIQITPTLTPSGQAYVISTLIGVPIVVSETTTTYIPHSHGRIASTTDQYGRITEFLYDSRGNTIQSRSQTFDELGNPLWLVTRTVVDGRGRTVFTTDPFLMPFNSSPYDLSPPVMGNRSLYDDLGRSYGSDRVADVQIGITPIVSGSTTLYATRLESPGIVISGTRTEFDGQGRAYKQIASDGQTTTSLYDIRGRIVATLGTAVESTLVGLGQRYPDKLVRLRSETEYNQYGQAFRSISNIVEVLNPASQSLISIDRSEQRITDQRFDAQGRVVETIYPDGSSTKREYDQKGRVSAEIDQLGQVKSLSYDNVGRLAKVELPSVLDPSNLNSQVRPTYQYEYNAFGQMSKLVDAKGRETLFAFDATGRQTARALPLSNAPPIAPGPTDPILNDSSSSTGETIVEWTQYDLRGRAFLTKSFEGVISRTSYEDTIVGSGRISERQLFKDAATYNNGQGVPDERVKMRYDVFGRTIETKHHYQTSGVIDTWSTTYDTQGRITQETSPTGFIRYEYDNLGRKTRTQSGSTVSAEILTDTHYTYDRLGKLATVTTSVRDGLPVDSDTVTPGNQPESTAYFFDILGRSDYSILPNNIVEDFSFDSMDRLDFMRHLRSDTTNADLSDNSVLNVFDYSYRADGKRVSLNESFKLEGADRKSSYTWSYDPAGRLTGEILDHWDDVFDQSESYIYDLVGNRLQKSIDKAGDTNDRVFKYDYDANDRIVSKANYGNLSSTGLPIESVEYTWRATQQSNRTVTQSGVQVSIQSMAYGLSGQLEQVRTETRNTQNEVQSRVQVSYRYDRSGLRFLAIDSFDSDLNTPAFDSVVTGRTEYLIDHMTMTGYGQAIHETVFNESNQATKRTTYIFGSDELTQTVTKLDPSTSSVISTETHTFAHDGHGSTRALFGSAATLVQLFTYTAYGELLAIHNGITAAIISGTASTLSSPASSLTPVLYNGEALDPTTNLYNFRARWYSASNARFERLDPYAGNQNRPFSFNKYGFVHGDPVQGVDPSGLVLLAIDGTSQDQWLTNPRNPRKLNNGRWLSHVRNFSDEYKLSGQGAFYDFGVTHGATGWDLVTTENKAIKYIEDRWSADPTKIGEPIDIIGWSRGAYSALRLSRRLETEGVKLINGSTMRHVAVRFLGLYDPVDMTIFDFAPPSLSLDRIFDNVQNAISITGRDMPGQTPMVDYNSSWGPPFLWPRMDVSASGVTNFVSVPMAATHGAIGGTPGYSATTPDPDNYNYPLDRQRSMESDRRIRQHAAAAGVPVRVLPDSAYGFPEQQSSLPKVIPRSGIAFIGEILNRFLGGY